MPELPEVETVVRALRRSLGRVRIGRVIYASRRVAANNVRTWRQQIAGGTIRQIRRRGKFIILALTGSKYLIVHLRLTGRLLLRDSRSRREPHDRLVMAISGGRLSDPRNLVLNDVRQFARADWCPAGEMKNHPGLSRLGVEATDVTHPQLAAMAVNSRRPIKSLLLDQTRIAGLGNIYADETLFLARIHPATPAHSIDRCRLVRLQSAIAEVMTAAIAACGTTFDTFSDLTGQSGGFGPQLNVYQRTGLACPVCSQPIERISLIGRGTHFCPGCQSDRS